MRFGKRFKKNAKIYDNRKSYSLFEAYKIITNMEKVKFDESIDISLLIKQNSKNSSLKSDVILPHGNGKNIKLLLLLNNGDNNRDLIKKYKINSIGGESFIKNILDGVVPLKYSYVITTPDMFPKLKPIAKILGPKGLMPTVKNGTVSNNVEQAIDNIYKGQINIKSSKEGNINLSIGRCSFTYEQIYDNFKALYNKIVKIKPSSGKNIYIKNISISTTMSPGIKIHINKF